MERTPLPDPIRRTPVRTTRFLPICLSSFLVTAALISPVAARAEPTQATVPDVVRVGDRAMTCEVLASEINTLARGPVATAARPKKKRGFGFLSALGGAVPFAGGMGGVLVSTAASSAAQMAAESATRSAMDDASRMAQDAMNGGSPEQQRKARLTAIFEEKRC